MVLICRPIQLQVVNSGFSECCTKMQPRRGFSKEGRTRWFKVVYWPSVSILMWHSPTAALLHWQLISHRESEMWGTSEWWEYQREGYRQGSWGLKGTRERERVKIRHIQTQRKCEKKSFICLLYVKFRKAHILFSSHTKNNFHYLSEKYNFLHPD